MLLKMNSQFRDFYLLLYGISILCLFIYGSTVFMHIRRLKYFSAKPMKSDSNSWAGLALQIAGFLTLFVYYRKPFGPLISSVRYLEIAGGMFAASFCIFFTWLGIYAIKNLGKQWTFSARIVSGHELVTLGPYRWVRHPIYTSLLGTTITTGCLFSSPFGLVLGTSLFLTGTLYSIKCEQRLLKEAFQEKFEQYRISVPSLIPNFFKEEKLL